MRDRLPAVFLGHGNPMNALADNRYSRAWRRLGRELPRPKTVLAISAHWYVPETAVTVSAAPRTVHDFVGFPRELFEVQYSARGDPELARQIQRLLAPVPVRLAEDWGLDHGTWSVLRHVFPDASVPVVQLSLDETQLAAFHFELGRKLAPLREEGVLIAGSGNLVHNLESYAWGRKMAAPYDWAVRFESDAREMIVAGEGERLVRYGTMGRNAQLSIPTPDHFLPLLVVLGARQEGEPISFPVEGVDGGSISMLSVQVG